jgi:hypothetical protein
MLSDPNLVALLLKACPEAAAVQKLWNFIPLTMLYQAGAIMGRGHMQTDDKKWQL